MGNGIKTEILGSKNGIQSINDKLYNFDDENETAVSVGKNDVVVINKQFDHYESSTHGDNAEHEDIDKTKVNAEDVSTGTDINDDETETLAGKDGVAVKNKQID